MNNKITTGGVAILKSDIPTIVVDEHGMVRATLHFRVDLLHLFFDPKLRGDMSFMERVGPVIAETKTVENVAGEALAPAAAHIREALSPPVTETLDNVAELHPLIKGTPVTGEVLLDKPTSGGNLTSFCPACEKEKPDVKYPFSQPLKEGEDCPWVCLNCYNYDQKTFEGEQPDEIDITKSYYKCQWHGCGRSLRIPEVHWVKAIKHAGEQLLSFCKGCANSALALGTAIKATVEEIATITPGEPAPFVQEMTMPGEEFKESLPPEMLDKGEEFDAGPLRIATNPEGTHFQSVEVFQMTPEQMLAAVKNGSLDENTLTTDQLKAAGLPFKRRKCDKCEQLKPRQGGVNLRPSGFLCKDCHESNLAVKEAAEEPQGEPEVNIPPEHPPLVAENDNERYAPPPPTEDGIPDNCYCCKKRLQGDSYNWGGQVVCYECYKKMKQQEQDNKIKKAATPAPQPPPADDFKCGKCGKGDLPDLYTWGQVEVCVTCYKDLKAAADDTTQKKPAPPEPVAIKGEPLIIKKGRCVCGCDGPRDVAEVEQLNVLPGEYLQYCEECADEGEMHCKVCTLSLFNVKSGTEGGHLAKTGGNDFVCDKCRPEIFVDAG